MSTLSSAAATTYTTITAPDTPGPGPWIDGSPEARIEELEEALRRIVIVAHPDPRATLSDTDSAILAMACDALGLDSPIEPARAVRRAAHLTAV